MNPSTVYVIVAILALAATAALVFVAGRQAGARRLSPLAGLAFALILAGLLFGENRWLGYGLLGLGVALAIGDMIYQLRTRP
jgi:hypothetical protein